MPQQLKESANLLAGARNVLRESERFLDLPKKKITLEGLLEQQQAVVEALSTLGRDIAPDYLSEAAEVRAKLNEHATTLRRELRRMKEEEEEDAAGDSTGAPSNEVTTNGDTSGGGDSKGDDDEGVQERLKRALGVKTLEGMDTTKLIESLVRTNLALRERIKGQVPKHRYRVAIELGEEVVSRANRDRKVYENKIGELQKQLKESVRQSQAAKSLLEATVITYRNEKVAGLVESFLAKNPQLRSIEGALRECRTAQQVRKLVEGVVRPLVEGSSARIDLKTPRTLTERAKGGSPNSRQTRSSNGNLMESLVAKEQGL